MRFLLPIYAHHSITILPTIRAPFCTPFCPPYAHQYAHQYSPIITHHIMISPFHSGTVVLSFLSFISLSKEENIMSILFTSLVRVMAITIPFSSFFTYSPTIRAPFAHHSDHHSITTRTQFAHPCEHLPTHLLPFHYPSYYTISHSVRDGCSFFFIFHFFIKGRKHTIHSYRTLIASFVHGTAITYYPYMHSIRAPFCPPFARPC